MEVGVQTIWKAVTSISLDVAIVAGLVVVAIFCAMRLGKHILIAFILASYPTYLLYSLMQLLKFTTVEQFLINDYARGTFFLVLWFGAFFCIQRFISVSYPQRHLVRLIEAVSLGIAASGLVFAFAYKTALVPALYAFSDTISQAFSSDIAFLAWLSLPFVVMTLLIRP